MACNGDDTDKLPLWILGKAKRPRCFKNVQLHTLGCMWRSNKKGWMNTFIMKEWLLWFDSHIAASNRRPGSRVLLLLDNLSVCPLSNITDTSLANAYRLISKQHNNSKKISSSIIWKWCFYHLIQLPFISPQIKVLFALGKRIIGNIGPDFAFKRWIVGVTHLIL